LKESCQKPHGTRVVAGGAQHGGCGSRRATRRRPADREPDDSGEFPGKRGLAGSLRLERSPCGRSHDVTSRRPDRSSWRARLVHCGWIAPGLKTRTALGGTRACLRHHEFMAGPVPSMADVPLSEVLQPEYSDTEGALRRSGIDLDSHRPAGDSGGWHWFPRSTVEPQSSTDRIHYVLLDGSIMVYDNGVDWLELTLCVAWGTSLPDLIVSAAVEVACWCPQNHNMHPFVRCNGMCGTATSWSKRSLPAWGCFWRFWEPARTTRVPGGYEPAYPTHLPLDRVSTYQMSELIKRRSPMAPTAVHDCAWQRVDRVIRGSSGSTHLITSSSPHAPRRRRPGRPCAVHARGRVGRYGPVAPPVCTRTVIDWSELRDHPHHPGVEVAVLLDRAEREPSAEVWHRLGALLLVEGECWCSAGFAALPRLSALAHSRATEYRDHARGQREISVIMRCARLGSAMLMITERSGTRSGMFFP
jgi:hypothetical protein